MDVVVSAGAASLACSLGFDEGNRKPKSVEALLCCLAPVTESDAALGVLSLIAVFEADRRDQTSFVTGLRIKFSAQTRACVDDHWKMEWRAPRLQSYRCGVPVESVCEGEADHT